MLDPVVHAALVVVFTWLLNLLLTYLKVDLGNDVVTGLAQWLVGYILSLFGYSLYRKLIPTNKLLNSGEYHPPFS